MLLFINRTYSSGISRLVTTALPLSGRQLDLAGELASLFARRDVADLARDLRCDPAADPRPLYRLLGGERLLAPHWPQEYGGRGYGQVEACQVLEALGHAGVGDTLYVTSVQVVGGVVLHHGDDRARRRFLPPLASGEAFASVLYSEEQAGSDLAAIRTSGTPDGQGGWRLDGRKVWSARTPLATDALCLFRTGDPARRGYDDLALALAPLDADGVRITPIPSLGAECFHEIRLEGVRVDAERVVARPGDAWPVISGAISYERTGFDYLTRAWRWLTAARVCWTDDEDLDRLEVAYHAARYLAYQEAERVDEHGIDDVAAAVVKLACSELAQRCAYCAAERSGWMAGWAPQAAAFRVLEEAWREAPGLTLSAGPSEMLVDLASTSLPSSALHRAGP
jgi:alkylation response protein AidB-like acyl-CoA dehydrogenase